MTVATKEDLQKQIADKKREAQQWIDQIVPMTIDVRQASLNHEWKQVEHFSDLIRSNLVMIRLAAEIIQANEKELANDE